MSVIGPGTLFTAVRPAEPSELTPELRAKAIVAALVPNLLNAALAPGLTDTIAGHVREAAEFECAAERQWCLLACDLARPPGHVGKECGCGECTGAAAVAELIREG